MRNSINFCGEYNFSMIDSQLQDRGSQEDALQMIIRMNEKMEDKDEDYIFNRD